MESESFYVVRRSTRRTVLDDLVLVLEARDIEHDLLRHDGEWLLVVPNEYAAIAIHEIAAFEAENRVVPMPSPPRAIDSGAWGVVGYLVVIWSVFLYADGPNGWTIESHGRVDAGKMMAGEIWRAFTALTLHADLGHIVANSLFGGLFGWLLGRYLGSGVAWFAIVMGGGLGNLLNAMLRPESFLSIGASTATFAAVGIGAVFMWFSGYFRSQPGPRGLAGARHAFAPKGVRGLSTAQVFRNFAPIVAAFAFFAFTGTGGDDTDVLAHFTGLLSGLLLGGVVVRNKLHEVGPRGQRFFGLAAFFTILASWAIAV